MHVLSWWLRSASHQASTSSEREKDCKHSLMRMTRDDLTPNYYL